MKLAYLDFECALGEPAALAQFAAAIGRTAAGAGLTLLDYATVRADGEHIRIGVNGYFAERATVHIVDGQLPAVLGDDATVGRFALVHACTVGDRIVVGEGAAVMDGSVVGDDVVVAADSIVAPNKKLAGGWLYRGVPAQPVRELSDGERLSIAQSIRSGRPDAIVRSAILPPMSPASFLPRNAGAGPLHAWEGRAPTIHSAYVAPTACLVGDVELHDDAGVYFGCVLGAQDGSIVIGARTNVQDNSLLITSADRGPIVLGEGITIGHNVQMGAGRFGDDALIGMMSRVADGVVVEPGGCIAAGAWVEPGTVVKSGWIWAGRPARPFREVRQSERDNFARGRDVYVGYGAAYRGK